MNQSVPIKSRLGGLLAPWFLASLAILASFAITRLWSQGRLARLLETPAGAGSDEPEAQELEVWQALLGDEGGLRVHCLLAPLHVEPGFQEHRSRSLGERWGLPPGSLMRLILTRPEGEADPEVFTGFEVLDAEGSCIQALASLLPKDAEGDAVQTLIARRGAILDPGDSEQIAGWGRSPGPEARLVLHKIGSSIELPLEAMPHPAGDLPRSFVQGPQVAEARQSRQERHQGPGAKESGSALERIMQLEAELASERQRVLELESARAEREHEILRFNTMLSSLPLPSELRSELGLVEEQAAPGDPEPAEEEPQPDPLELRAGEVKLALRTLLTLEGLYALDLLEVGSLREPVPATEEPGEDGELVPVAAQAGWIGPVLFRLLDARGRLNGSLHAQRLHLEGSRSSRTLHVVLTDGYESHQGVRTPFDGGVRRISLPLVDPERWIDRLPELFSPEELDPEIDDGLWDLGALRLELNALLGQGSMAGWYRFHGFGGVLGEELREIQLQEFASTGRLRRRLFADRLRIVIDERGVSLELSGGSIAESDAMLPFRDGRHTIFLPAADPAEWRAHRLPGVSATAEQPEPQGQPEDQPQGAPPGDQEGAD